MLGIKVTGDWEEAVRVLERAEKQIGPAVERALAQEAQALRGLMVEHIDTGAFRPHAPATLFLRRATGGGKGSKVLIASGALRSSFRVVKLAGGGVFVGVLRTNSTGRGQTRRGNVAMIQEFGANITVTPRMRRFLHAKLRKAGAPPPPPGAARVTIRIPPRPFVGPVIDWYLKHEWEHAKPRILAKVVRSIFGSKAARGL